MPLEASAGKLCNCTPVPLCELLSCLARVSHKCANCSLSMLSTRTAWLTSLSCLLGSRLAIFAVTEKTYCTLDLSLQRYITACQPITTKSDIAAFGQGVRMGWGLYVVKRWTVAIRSGSSPFLLHVSFPERAVAPAGWHIEQTKCNYRRLQKSRDFGSSCRGPSGELKSS